MIAAGQSSRQNNKSLLIVAVLLTALILATVVPLLWPREPVYGGRGLSSWLQDLDAGKVETQAEAAAAMKQMGPKATPFIAIILRRSHVWYQQRRLRQELQSWVSWLRIHVGIGSPVPNHRDTRQEALAALDALRADAAGALPALQELMKENPPDPRALYVIARTGEAGLPILTNALTSEEKIIRVEAQVCLQLVRTHSELLFGEVASGTDAATFQRRLCRFNLEVLQLAFRQYREQSSN